MKIIIGTHLVPFSPVLRQLSREDLAASGWVGQWPADETLDNSSQIDRGMADTDGKLRDAHALFVIGEGGKARVLAATFDMSVARTTITTKGDAITPAPNDGGGLLATLRGIEFINDLGIRAALMSRVVMREFELYRSDPDRRSSASVALFKQFGIDPEEHESFPWNSDDTLRRARLYFRIKQSKLLMQSLFRRIAMPGQQRLLRILMNRIWNAVTVQDVKDTKLKFTPHGWEHSLDTVILQRSILEQSASLRRALKEKFGTLVRGRAMMDLVGILHDIGYGRLAADESKGIHAVRSGEIFQQELAPLIRKIFGLNGSQIREIHDAIAYHGADKREQADYHSASSNNEPLLFLIRLADNLDAASNRLRSIQTHPLFIAALKEMHDLRNDPDMVNNSELMGVAVFKIKEVAYRRFESAMCPSDIVLAKGLLEKMNELSWPHFKGCEKVARIEAFEIRGKLVVTFEIKGFADAGRVHEDVSETIDGALYQLWRAYGAAKSLRFAGKSIHFRFASVVEGYDAKHRKLKIITDMRRARTGRFRPITSNYQPYTAPVWKKPE